MVTATASEREPAGGVYVQVTKPTGGDEYIATSYNAATGGTEVTHFTINPSTHVVE